MNKFYTVCFFCSCLLIGAAQYTHAGEVAWKGREWNQNWETPENWKGGECPTRQDDIIIDKNHLDVVLSGLSDVSVQNLVLGREAGFHGVLRLLMYGGTLEIGGKHFLMSTKPGSKTEFVMCDGSVSGGRNTEASIGNQGKATFSINGGQVCIPGAVHVPAGEGEGRLNVHGGIFSCGSLKVSEVGRGVVDVTTGILLIDGDVREQMQGYVNRGALTAFNGFGNVQINFDFAGGKTRIQATLPKQPAVNDDRLAWVTNGTLTIAYDLDSGRASLYQGQHGLIRNFFSEVRLPNLLTSMDYTERSVVRSEDATVIVSAGKGLPVMRQYFRPHRDAFLIRTEIEGGDLAASWFSPLTVAGAACVAVEQADPRVLVAPFDNAQHVRYHAMPVNCTWNGYNLVAIYDNESRRGLVLGVVNSRVWKTGTLISGSNGAVDYLTIYGGAAAPKDVEPHAPVSGTVISSPEIMIGYAADWRRGLEAYGMICADITPPLALPAGDNGGIPLGWKSYGKYGAYSDVSLDVVKKVADYMNGQLKPAFVNEKGVAYVLLGAGGQSQFKKKELKEYVDYCHANSLKAGSYFTPFKIGGAPDKDLSRSANGSGYKWIDLVLKDHQQGKPIIDQGRYALDPTHPGTRKIIKDNMDKYHRLGIDWLRMDFNDIGALEGAHYQKGVTGMQAYREGMEYIAKLNAGRMHLNLAISPVFPSQFAHSRRISNDVNASVRDSEYQLNSLAYGWWLDRLYSHNDPGNVAFDPEGDPAVAKMRMQAAVICSGQIVGVNDWSTAMGQQTSCSWLINEQIMELARKHPCFYPIEGNTGGAAPTTFMWRDRATLYLAVFNYSPEPARIRLDFDRAGVKQAERFDAVELWSGQREQFSQTINLDLKGNECRLYRMEDRK